MLELLPPVLQVVDDDVPKAAGVSLRMLRLDLIHPLISGNKWYKLRRNLDVATKQGQSTLLSFGGAWSNHLYALAAAGKAFGFKTIGVVRGELAQPLNPVLAFARQQGMTLHPVSRSDYRHKDTAEFQSHLHHQYGDFLSIPEGGGNVPGVLGCTAIVDHLAWTAPPHQRHLWLACGTGATMAGTLGGLAENPTNECHVSGVCVLKGGLFLVRQIADLISRSGLRDPGNWQIHVDDHCGGYAKTTPELLDFIMSFHSRTGIPLEHVYTGKLMFALYKGLAAGAISRGSEIIAIHTGGIHRRESEVIVVNIPT